MTQPAPRTITWTPHYRVSWGGSLGNPAAEVWTNTLRFRSDQDVLGQGGPVLDHDGLQDVANSLVPILSGWMTDAAANIGSAARFEWVKCNWVNSAGLQPDQDTIIAEANPGVAGTGTGGTPWLVSYALTLRTAVARGRAHAGRIYPPVPGAFLEPGTPYIGLASATGMATAFARIIYAMQEAFNASTAWNDPDVHAIVASPGDSAIGKPALYQQITGVVCDRVTDVMHSRNRQVPRSEGALVAPGP